MKRGKQDKVKKTKSVMYFLLTGIALTFTSLCAHSFSACSEATFEFINNFAQHEPFNCWGSNKCSPLCCVIRHEQEVKMATASGEDTVGEFHLEAQRLLLCLLSDALVQTVDLHNLWGSTFRAAPLICLTGLDRVRCRRTLHPGC